MHGYLIPAIEGRVLIIPNVSRVVKVSAVRPFERMMFVFVGQTHGEDILIRIWNGRRESRVRDGTLIELIARAQDPVRGESPVAANTGGESIFPLLREFGGREKKGVGADVQVQGIEARKLQPFHIGLDSNLVREFDAVPDGYDIRIANGRAEVGFRGRSEKPGGGSNIADFQVPLVLNVHLRTIGHSQSLPFGDLPSQTDVSTKTPSVSFCFECSVRLRSNTARKNEPRIELLQRDF